MRTVRLKILAFVLASSSAGAEIVPGRWEKVDALAEGFGIIVELKQGDRLGGLFLESRPDELFLKTAENARLGVLKSDILRVLSQAKTADPLKNGVRNGLIAGAAVGLPFLIYGFTCRCSERGDTLRIVTGITLWSVGLGAGIGAAVDASLKSHQVLYQAPKPRDRGGDDR